MVTQKLNLNVIPGGVMPVVNVSQYDKGERKLQITLYNGSSAYNVPSGATVMIQGTKPDKTGFAYNCTYSDNVITSDIEAQMTVLSGVVVTEVVVFVGEDRIASANFVLAVEPAALNDETQISETEIPDIIALATEQMERAEAAAETAVEAVESIGDSVERAEAAATSAAADAESASDDASTASSAATTASAAASTATSAATSATTAATDAHGWADNNGDSGQSSYSATNNAYYWAMLAASAAGGGLQPEIVQTLPTTNISTSTMYFVPSQDPQTSNVYDEYINLDGTVAGYEMIGSTAIDMSNYYTKAQVDAKIAVEDMEWDDWNAMTEAEKDAYSAGKRINLLNVPGAEGSIDADLMTLLYDGNLSNNDTFSLPDNTYSLLLCIVRGRASGIAQLNSSGNGRAVMTSTYPDSQNSTIRACVDISGHINGTFVYTMSGGWSSTSEHVLIYGLSESVNLKINALAPEVSTLADKCMLSDGETSVEDALSELENIIIGERFSCTVSNLSMGWQTWGISSYVPTPPTGYEIMTMIATSTNENMNALTVKYVNSNWKVNAYINASISSNEFYVTPVYKKQS